MDFKAKDVSPSQFLSYFLHVGNVIRIMHRQNSNPAVHEPLRDLYSEIDTHTDSICEKYQGYKGQLVTGYCNYDLSKVQSQNPLIFVESLKSYLDTSRSCFGDYSPIQNEVDNLANSINLAIFKLKFNKSL